MAKVLETPEFRPESKLKAGELDKAADLYGEDIPAPSDYLSIREMFRVTMTPKLGVADHPLIIWGEQLDLQHNY